MKTWIKVLIIGLCILVLGTIFYLITDMQNKIDERKEMNIVSSSNSVANVVNTLNNTASSNVVDEKEKQNIIDEPKATVEPTPSEAPTPTPTPTIDDNDSSEEVDVQSSINEEENRKEAIELVKKKWGENDDSVYYTNEGKNEDGEYLVAVRSKSSTYIEENFRVNIETKTVKIIL